MKKLRSVFILFCLCLILTSCNSKAAPASPYTAEFPYLPVYSSAMELQDITTNINGTDYANAVYTVKGATNEELLDNYEQILLNDGWEVYEDKRPLSIAFKKDEHRVMLLPQQSSNHVNLNILAK